ncbi:MAG: hypothetical protein Tsb009_16910 [Planctomycetaceae bacterium]
MKRRQHTHDRIRFRKRRRKTARVAHPPVPHERSGSTIVVVIVLMMGLLFLGMLLFTEASQEEVNAEYYADSGKATSTDLDPEPLFETSLRQIILGANNNEHQSPFYGGRISQLPLMFGRDMHLFSGEGVHVSYSAAVPGGPFVDQDLNNIPDAQSHYLQINQSPAATGEDRTDVTLGTALNFFPEPDVDYVYPDHTNPFLSYSGRIRQNGAGVNRVRLASYSRPQLLRGIGIPPANWYTAAATAPLVMRPHREHRAILSDGSVAMTSGGQPIRRFVSTAYPDTTPNPINPFPFGALNHGVWTGNGNGFNLDADPDGDGINEAVYLDMDLPMFTTPDGSQTFVPMVAVTIRDLDGLLNLNATGNVVRMLQANGLTPNRPAAGPNFISMSHQATSRSEINPQWVLQANPAAATGPNDFAQHNFYFGRLPASARDLANMEWWWFCTGRPEFQAPGGFSNITGLVDGRWGESTMMKTMFGPSPQTFPRPGRTAFDDNGNRVIGGAYNSAGSIFPLGVQFPAYGQPVDYRGRGTVLLGGSPTQRELGTIGRHRFPTFRNYYSNNPASYPSTLLPGSALSFLQDEPWETRLWANLASGQKTDSILGPAQTAAMHMTIGDRTVTGSLSSRILKLMPYNLATSPTAEETSRKLTTQSWDVKSHGKTYYRGTAAGYRQWEFTPVGGGVSEFPPTFATNDPFRLAVRRVLAIQNRGTTDKRPQRKLNINGIVDTWPAPSNRLRFRPLTPHPVGIPNDVISGPNSILGNYATRIAINRPERIGTDSLARQRQEWLARYDRQRLCRDIYVMLYMFGGGRDDINYRSADNSNQQIYTDAQLREMAQLAVNWVDALDPDDNITKFEYDKNLSNGWQVNDDPYDESEASLGATFTRLTAGATRFHPDYPEDSLERGVVYGVEAHKLSFSETLAIVSKEIMDPNTMMPFDHPATEYDDKKNRRFLFIELQNATPNAISLANDAYQIVIKNKPGENHVIERRLTLQGLLGSISAPRNADDVASRLTIATIGDVDNRATNAMSGVRDGALLPSYFKVNPLHGEAGDMMAFSQIAPKGSSNILDLLRVNGSNPNGFYRVNAAPSSSADLFSDGQEIPHNISANPKVPSGVDFLKFIEVGGDGGKAKEDSILSGNTVEIVLQLRRRANVNRIRPTPNISGTDADHIAESADNPWVVVDEMIVRVRPFQLEFNHDGSDAQNLLRTLWSYERHQPLSQSFRVTPVLPTDFNTADPNSWSRNTLGTANRANSAAFPLWQPHGDRNFTSVTELFHLPLYGPHELTKRLGKLGPNEVDSRLWQTTTSSTPNKIYYRSTANNRFLRPDRTTPRDFNPARSSDPNPAAVNNGNRWYRLLEFFEVSEPDPIASPWLVVDGGSENSLGFYRTPGKINLNMVRHPGVLAGLIDDPNLLTVYNPNGPLAFLQDGSGRTWYHDFLVARDGIDPLGTNLTLPGVPGAAGAYNTMNHGARPFRNLSYALNGEYSLEHTVLRSRIQDSASHLQNRRLFEVGSLAQHTNRETTTSIDYTTRSRLLSKVMNNSTTRSNVFVIFVQIDYFEAKEVTSSTGEKVVRIGRKLPTSPGYRKVYVVDRSKAMNIVKPSDLPRIQGGRFTYSFNQNLDFSSLILHEQRIR